MDETSSLLARPQWTICEISGVWIKLMASVFLSTADGKPGTFTKTDHTDLWKKSSWFSSRGELFYHNNTTGHTLHCGNGWHHSLVHWSLSDYYRFPQMKKGGLWSPYWQWWWLSCNAMAFFFWMTMMDLYALHIGLSICKRDCFVFQNWLLSSPYNTRR